MRKSAFVLEDDIEIREIFTLVLRDAGYEVNSYRDSESFARAIASLSPPDVIITDVRLPDGNGIDICNALKADPTTASIPILIISAHKDLLSMKINSQADDHLEKPFDINVLVDKVNRLSGNA